MKLIVGLGNPETKYDNTYHNMGFAAINDFASRRGFKIKKLECKACIHIGKDFILAKPQTYMNLSGESVAGLVKKHNIDMQDILVIYDDLDIGLGQIRVRKEGSGGTHNGMRNIVSLLGTTNFPRLRIGIGRPNEHMDIADYVLSNIPKSAYPIIEETMTNVTEAISDFIGGVTIENIMNKYNK